MRNRQKIEAQFLDCWSSLGDITRCSMFDGQSFYWNGVIFAILYRDRLYLKVDDQSQGDFESRG